jgi:peptidoglycan/xylan/chitin deacetylase (PgdA/CDA1 family)
MRRPKRKTYGNGLAELRDSGSSPHAIPVLMYHSVSEHEGTAFDITPRRFIEHISAIVDAGCTGLSVDRFSSCLAQREAWPPHPVVITFDDGRDDAVAAVEHLVSNGLAATVYVATGMIGLQGHVDESALRHLVRLPEIVVGAHSVTHPRLNEVRDAVARREIVDSKKRLEDVTQESIRSFAYPYGEFNKRVRQIVIDSGFESAAAVRHAFSRPGDDHFAFARLAITSHTTPKTVADWMNGVGAPMARDGDNWWRPAARLARRIHRRIQHSR